MAACSTRRSESFNRLTNHFMKTDLKTTLRGELLLLAFLTCLLFAGHLLSAAIPEPTGADAERQEWIEDLRTVVEAAPITSQSEWYRKSLEADARHASGEPDPAWVAELTEAGIAYGDLEATEAYRAQLLRRQETAAQARWKILQEPGAVYAAEPLRVIDGDTLDVRIDLEGDGHAEVERLRLYGIDTVERHEPGGAEAAEALTEYVTTQPLTLWVPTRETDYGVQPERGKYGRLLAVIYAGNPPAGWDTVEAALYQTTCVNEELARAWGK